MGCGRSRIMERIESNTTIGEIFTSRELAFRIDATTCQTCRALTYLKNIGLVEVVQDLDSKLLWKKVKSIEGVA